MGFTGAGVYEIVPYQAPKLNLNSWEGKMAAGAVVKTYDRGNPPSDNAKWQVALASGSGDSAEYLIINVHTGYLLTATGDNQIASTPQNSPAADSSRWFIKSRQTNGYDVFTITSKVTSRGQLTVKEFSTQSGADVQSASKQDADNQKWYFDPR